MPGCLKNLRVAQSPIISLFEDTNITLDLLRRFREEAGIQFIVNPPLRTGGNVPRESNQLTNNLHIAKQQ